MLSGGTATPRLRPREHGLAVHSGLGHLIRLKAEHLSKERDFPPVRSWSSKGGAADDVDCFRQTLLRRFDLKRTFSLRETAPGQDHPQTPYSRGRGLLDLAPDRRPHSAPTGPALTEGLRRPWERPTVLDRLTPARVRMGDERIRAHRACPAQCSRTHRHWTRTATRHQEQTPGTSLRRRQTVKGPETLKAIGKPGRCWRIRNLLNAVMCSKASRHRSSRWLEPAPLRVIRGVRTSRRAMPGGAS